MITTARAEHFEEVPFAALQACFNPSQSFNNLAGVRTRKGARC